MNKVIIKWLEELPSPVKEKAIANCADGIQYVPCVSLATAIRMAFHWENTPEGYTYWDEEYKRLLLQEIDAQKKTIAELKSNIKTELSGKRCFVNTMEFSINNSPDGQFVRWYDIQKILGDE